MLIRAVIVMYFTHPGPHSTWMAANLNLEKITPLLDEKCHERCRMLNRMCVCVCLGLGVILAEYVCEP